MTSGTRPIEDRDVAWLRDSLAQCQRELADLRDAQEHYLETQATIDRLASQLDAVSRHLDDYLRTTERRPAGWRGRVKGRLDRRVPSPGEAEDLALLRSSDLFDGAWYLRQYPEVAATGLSPALHYLRHGAAEGKNPGPEFETESYRRLNPPVARLGINPLVQHIRAEKARSDT